LVGDSGVGKTHLLSRYNKGILPKEPNPTIGVEFTTKIVTLKNGPTVNAQIWDTGIYLKTININ
jgi:Rab family protein